jgi:hypothetical protein
MTDADFSSSAATPDGGAASPPSPADGGAVEPSRDSDGNQFAGGRAKTIDAHGPSRDARDDGEQPVDLDQPAEWQGAEAGLRAEEIIKELAPPQRPQRPQDFPRSWATDSEAAAIWDQLPPQARAQITQREQQRDTEVTRAQTEFATRTREVEAVIAHSEEVNRQALQALVPELEPFADLFEPGRLAAERQANPQRAQAFEQLFNRVESLRLTGQQLLEVRAEQHRAQQEQFFTNARAAWEAQKKAEDVAAEKLIPGLADPGKREAIAKIVYEYVDKLGISREQFHHWYETEPLLRGAAGQKVLYDAAMWNRAQRAAFEAKPKPQPKPLMPGVNNGPSRGSGDAALAAAASNGDMDTYFRLRGNSGARR